MATYLDHIEELCKENGIQIFWTEQMNGEWPVALALPQARMVKFHKPTSDFLYLVALHEIGHVMTDVPGDRLLEREAKAWIWAMNNYDLSIDTHSWRMAFTALSSYIARMIKRELRRQRAFVPQTDHWFWYFYINLAKLAFPEEGYSYNRAIRDNVYQFVANKI